MMTKTDARTSSFEVLVPATRVEPELGLLRGVAVISEGPALGHGMLIDAITLEQVKAAAEAFTGGLKVKMEHYSSVGAIVGYLTNFQIIGTVLRADLQLLESSEHRAYVLEIAQKIPASFGLSISFSGTGEKRVDEATQDILYYARCTEIYSADLVGEPAANPTGLFSSEPRKDCDLATPTPTTPPMTEEEKAAMLASFEEMLAPLAARLSALENPPMPEPDGDEETEMQKAADLEAMVKRVALEAAKETIQQFNLSAPAPAPSSPPAPDPEPTPKPKAFEDLVKAAKAEGKDHNAAVRHCMAANAEAYQAYLSRVQAGEKITL